MKPIKPWKGLTFTDDYMFKKVMEARDICRDTSARASASMLTSMMTANVSTTSKCKFVKCARKFLVERHLPTL